MAELNDSDAPLPREQWQHALSEEDRGLICGALSPLMVAEERITTKFAGLVMAAETEEEPSYLASQQVERLTRRLNIVGVPLSGS